MIAVVSRASRSIGGQLNKGGRWVSHSQWKDYFPLGLHDQEYHPVDAISIVIRATFRTSAFVFPNSRSMHVKNMKSSSTLGVGSDVVSDVTDVAMIVVFGRPGAGKSSVAEEAVGYIDQRGQSDKGSTYDCLALDLDTCVPKWMRDNFAKGVYPTHEERLQFAHSACDYVEAQVRRKRNASKDNHPISVIVSFSFVNTDLREVYRSRFPTAIWALVDTTEEEATVRINQREGHFYKGAPPAVSDDPTTTHNDGTSKDSITEKNNSEWLFAPVTFHHIILGGEDSIIINAVKVVNELDSLRAKIQEIISSESEI